MAKPSRGKSSSAQPAAGPAAKKAKPSSAKKVQRVARAGGRTSGGGGRRNLAFPAIVGTVLVLGVALVVFARSEGEVAAEPPTIADHWHSAYEFVQCDTVLPVSVNDADPNGIHTHGDGVMHIHPGAAQQVARAGERATLGVFMEAFGGEITDDRLTLEDGIAIGVFPADCPYVADIDGYKPPREHWTDDDLELYAHADDKEN